jgi:hypothetical protein
MAEIGKVLWGQYKRIILKVLRFHPDGLHWKNLFAELDTMMPANTSETKRLALLDAKGLFSLRAEYYEKLPQASGALMALNLFIVRSNQNICHSKKMELSNCDVA